MIGSQVRPLVRTPGRHPASRLFRYRAPQPRRTAGPVKGTGQFASARPPDQPSGAKEPTACGTVWRATARGRWPSLMPGCWDGSRWEQGCRPLRGSALGPGVGAVDMVADHPHSLCRFSTDKHLEQVLVVLPPRLSRVFTKLSTASE